MSENLQAPASADKPSEGPSRPRPKPPTITIDTTNLEASSKFSGPKINVENPTQLSASMSRSSPSGHVSAPHSRTQSASSNMLDLPGQSPLGSSQRPSVSESTGIPYPSSAVTSSYAGEEKSETRNLLTKDEPEMPDNPFAFTPKLLAKLHDPKDLNVLREMGGIEGLTYGLWSDIENGLSQDEDHISGRRTLQDCWNGIQVREEEKLQQKLDEDNRNEAEEINVERGTEDNPKSVEEAKRIESSNVKRKGSISGRRATLTSLKSQVVSKGFSDRKRIFSENRIPARKPKGIFQLMWMALHDKILILLCIAAVVSLALGFYQSFRPGATDKVEWVEGVAILAAITIVTVVQSVNDYQKERQFMKLNEKKEDRNVKVIRDGKTSLLNVYEIVVGDVLHIEPGDLIPVDGVLPEGHNIKADESAATGESDALRKVPAKYALRKTEPGSKFSNKYDPFVLSGSKILEGVGKYIVTAVGPNSFHGRTMMSLHDEPEDTPLQLKLNRVADMIAKIGGAAAILLFTVLLIKFLVSLHSSTLANAGDKGQQFMQILIVSVTIVVVAVPEGLPLAVTLSLAYATTRMLKDNNLVRVLKACETMGNATTICSDKTGTLTQNRMTVTTGTLGIRHRFGDKRQTVTDIHNQKGVEEKAKNLTTESNLQQEEIMSKANTMEQFFNSLAPDLQKLLRDSVALNSTAFEGTDDKGDKEFVGSKTETALLSLSRDYLGMEDIDLERRNAEIVQLIPFNSDRKCMGCIVKMDRDGEPVHRLFVKGASEILLAHSKFVIDISSGSVAKDMLSEDDRKVVENTIEEYASKSLRTIGLLYRDFPKWPPKGIRRTNDDNTQVEFDKIFDEMVLIGVVGIMDPLRPGVTEAVEDCRKAGVFVRMVTGDNLLTAKAIATECGIFTRGGVIMEGPVFRSLSKDERDRIIPRLQVLARSSPEDKRTLVKRLKELGETVAVTGDGTNDGPALKTADVGFSMGIAGTEVAKEASSIILMDDNFASIVKAIMWGRCVSDAVKKFLQFQLTVNITAVGLAVVSSIASGTEQSALTAVQLLWVNLIMDTFAALALATDPPTMELLNRKPEPKNSSIISFNMWKMIFGQAVLQLTVTFVLNFAGRRIFTGWDPGAMQTVTFNTFVWLQVFNEINCRRLDNKLNVFSGIHRNPFFIGITVIIVIGQILIVFVGGTAFSVTRLNGQQWAASIVLGLLSLPFGAIIRIIPNKFIKIFIPQKLLERRRQTDEEQITEWSRSIDALPCDLKFIKNIRGKRRLGSIGDPNKRARLLTPSPNKGNFLWSRRQSKTKKPSLSSRFLNRNSSDRRRSSQPKSAVGPASIVPALIATSVVWSPTSPDSKTPPFMTRADLENREGIEVHKDTDPQDPIVGEGAESFSPLEADHEQSPVEHGGKAESPKRYWREKFSQHSRPTSIPPSPMGMYSPTGGSFGPRHDVSGESRLNTRISEGGKGSTPTEQERI